MIVTQAVQTKDGWRGQVIVDKEIVYETTPVKGSAGEDAVQAANRRVVDAFKAMFAAPALDE